MFIPDCNNYDHYEFKMSAKKFDDLGMASCSIPDKFIKISLLAREDFPGIERPDQKCQTQTKSRHQRT